MKRWWFVLIPLAGLITLASGWRAVEPGEVVVVRRFGRVLADTWGPGAHWAWPLGIDRLDRLRIDEIRRLEFGRMSLAGPRDEPGLGEYLTGDRNIVRAHGVVQYRVLNPAAFVLRAGDIDAILSRATEASLARTLASRTIDDPLRTGRAGVARDMMATLRKTVEDLGLGVEIVGVNLIDARPPTEVEAAFADAQAAVSERDRKINEARALASLQIPSARASAQSLDDLARSAANRQVASARAEADRFVRLLEEARRSRILTVKMLYRDALRDLLPKVRTKVLISTDEPMDLGLIGTGND